jgi:hypothetical protein
LGCFSFFSFFLVGAPSGAPAFPVTVDATASPAAWTLSLAFSFLLFLPSPCSPVRVVWVAVPEATALAAAASFSFFLRSFSAFASTGLILKTTLSNSTLTLSSIFKPKTGEF